MSLHFNSFVSMGSCGSLKFFLDHQLRLRILIVLKHLQVLVISDSFMLL